MRLATAALLAVAAFGLNACSRSDEAGKGSATRAVDSFAARMAQADAESQNWLTHGRTYAEERFSPLTEINADTLARLQLAWSYDLDTDRGQEATPLVVDGVMFTTSAWSKVQAFDAVTGKLLWQFDPKVPGTAAAKACCDVVNRGAAYWDGKVYVGTIDGRLIALDAKSGAQVWSTLTVDPANKNTITGAPRIVKGKVVIGNGGGELGVRGYVSAYDAATGEKVWRFYTVPGEPGRPDGEISDEPLQRFAAGSWKGEWWKQSVGGGGGGTVWDSMAYDPELDLLYIGTGNGSLQSRAARSPGGGDNLFIASILALRPDTGEYVWHYQQTPGDQWDYTSTQHMILTTLKLEGVARKVLLQAPKNGYFYVIDRATGKLISAQPYIPLNWSEGIDLATGRPNIKQAARYDETGEQWIGMPSQVGGHNWQPMSLSATTGLVYIPIQEVPGIFKVDSAFKMRPQGMNLGLELQTLELPDDPKVRAEALKIPKGFLIAWDPVAQREVWRAPNPGWVNGGVLSTAGNLVFQGDADGMFNAHDARNGKVLWSFDGQSGILAAPISYAVNGKQYVSVVVGFGGAVALVGGEAMWGKQGPRRNKSRVLTFALDGSAPALPPLDTLAQIPWNPPAAVGDAKTIQQGRMFYLNTCAPCHGGNVKSAGVIRDLRHSGAIASKEAFYAIVGEGALTERGMVSFKENYDAQEIEAIRAFIVSVARRDAARGER
ncbi:PQQ-dependent dehydrogenase, methanol/ethanol family [Steroidobacter sp.]|uniref:PQQ-dependent dehydrogenase, methanol/ethanol family n=1 Tax=Steroidobacter sp. TaxID=1978227 RepID=UPI001A4520B1|nr:PQQ-dependent dehydrogenase, methanol/ethanol family [Steroidobacter sp.]MBL8267743.1 PQQ-dependent dehydrogenase, methanol/ethanol family [Steroidobacter sp.]